MRGLNLKMDSVRFTLLLVTLFSLSLRVCGFIEAQTEIEGATDVLIGSRSLHLAHTAF